MYNKWKLKNEGKQNESTLFKENKNGNDKKMLLKQI